MSASPPVTAVIPVHNRADLLARLLASMREQAVPFAQTIVVDNASTDTAADLARAEGCRVISMGENAGFARAVNRGWQEAAPGWIAVLNSDVELDPRWLERLLANAGDAAFVTGTIYKGATRGRTPEIVDGTYDLVSRAGCAWRAGHGAPEKRAGHGQACETGTRQARTIDIAPATACLYRREVLDRLGGFDESFGSYLEDVDLGLRCIREDLHGVWVPDAFAWHQGSATLGRWNPRVVRLISRNQLRLVGRHYDAALFRSSLRAILSGQLLWGLVALRRGAGFAWLRGKLDGLRGFRLEGAPTDGLRRFLEASEREIEARAGDTYWRWYFRLAGAHPQSPARPADEAV